MSVFNDKVEAIVRAIPQGKVVTYGQVAALLGVPRAARAVGWALHWMVDTTVPCQRVVNRFGGLASGYGWGGQAAHKLDLLNDGVEVRDDYTVDLEKYQWWPSPEELPEALPTDYQIELDQKLPENGEHSFHRKTRSKMKT